MTPADREDIKQLQRDVKRLARESEARWLRIAECPPPGEASATYLLTNCEDSSDTIVVCNDLSGHVNRVAIVRLGDVVNCYLISESDCRGCECVEVITIVDTCAECLACYKLTNCDDQAEIPFFYSTDKRLAAWISLSPQALRFPDWDENDHCWLVERVPSCINSLGDIEGEIVPVGFGCESCGDCWTVQNCANNAIEKYIALTFRFTDNFPPALGEITEPADAIGYVFEWNGECWEVTGYGECSGESEIVPPPRSDQWHEDCAACGCYELRPCPDQEGDPPSLYVTRVIKDGEPLDLSKLTRNNPAACHPALKIDETGYCYTVHRSQECDEIDEPGEGEYYTVLEVYGCSTGFGPPVTARGCAACRCYELTSCDDENTKVCTYSNFWDYVEVDPNGDPEEPTYLWPGWVFKRKESEGGGCWKLTGFAICTSECEKFTAVAGVVGGFGPLPSFGKEENACALCEGGLVKLAPACGCDSECEDCEDGTPSPPSGDPIYSNDDCLRSMAGQYVKVSGKCYFAEAIEELPDGAEVTEDICFTGPYATCGACQAAESRITLSYLTFVDGELVAKNITLSGAFNVCDESPLEAEEC